MNFNFYSEKSIKWKPTQLTGTHLLSNYSHFTLLLLHIPIILLLMADPKQLYKAKGKAIQPTTRNRYAILEDLQPQELIPYQYGHLPPAIQHRPLTIREPSSAHTHPAPHNPTDKGKKKLYPENEDTHQQSFEATDGESGGGGLQIGGPSLSPSSQETTTINGDPQNQAESSIAALTRQARHMKLTEPVLSLKKKNTETYSQQWTVAAKIISQRRFNILVIRNTIQQSWRLRGEFAMARFPDNVFTIRFDNQLDYERVLEERPWNIQNHHFNIQEWPNDIPLSKINFDESLFWVHVNGLPPNLITIENGKMIGELFSGFVEVDLNEFAPLWRQHFLRIRVRVNNTEPFKTGFHNVTGDGGTEWIYFTYEKLPDICYFCGCMGHTVKFCLKRIDEETEGKVFMGSLMYGPQLRTAAMMHSSRLSLVRARTRYFQATQQREQSQVPEMQSSSPTPAPPMGNSSQTYVVSLADNEIPVVVSVGTNYLSRIISTTEVDATMLSNLEQWRVSDIMQSNIPAMYGATEPIFSTLTQTGIHNLLEPMSPFSCPSLTELSPVREWRLPPNMVNALSPRVQTEYRQLSPMVSVGQDLQSDILVDYLYASGYRGSNEGGISSVDLAEIRELLSDIYRGGPFPIIAPPQQTEQQAEPTVISAIPTYTMLCFRLPAALCQKINSLMNRFWWGQKQSERKIHWISWKKMRRSKWEGGLGFKDFTNFNRALLAKQAWRLLKNQDSILFQLLRGRYFRTSSFMNAPKGSGSSWGWQSIWYGKQLLNMGLRWQINGGSHIRVFEDPWLPTEFPFHPPRQQNNQVLFQLRTDSPTVSQLLNYQSKTWNTGVIRHIFDQQTAEAILSLPLSESSNVDNLIWHHTKSGTYSVKSGYYISLNMQGESNVISNHILQKKDWQFLWNLNIPNKIKVFIWRVLMDGIPTGTNLNLRLQTTHVCPHCNAQEDAIHLFFHCPFAQKVWFGSRLTFQSNRIDCTSFAATWSKICDDLSKLGGLDNSIKSFCYLLWAIWKARNSAIFKDTIWTESTTIESATAYESEFNQAQLAKANFSRANHSHLSGATANSSSNSRSIIIRYDAGTNKVKKFGAIAGIAFSKEGSRLGSFTAIFQFIWDPGILEFLALREVMKWSIRMGWSDVSFEGDAIQVSQSINSGCCQLSSCWGICQDIWWLKTLLQSASVKHIKRDNNKEAHRLVQQAKANYFSIINQ